MQKISFPEFHFPVQGLEQVRIPKMVRIREIYESDYIEDIRGHLIRSMHQAMPDPSAVAGKSIAITMGSHGGGNVRGNLEVLEGYGITEAAIGVPIRATMDVVQIGTLPDSAGTPVYCDRYAAEADGTLRRNLDGTSPGFCPHQGNRTFHGKTSCDLLLSQEALMETFIRLFYFLLSHISHLSDINPFAISNAFLMVSAMVKYL